ncbi:MAG: DUF3179 domain-containing (seleno)protein, partial [Gemmatimonadales bacterium]
MHWSPGAALIAALAGALALAPPAGAQDRTEWRTDFSRHTVSLDEIVSGGPPKDGIPAIDRPAFVAIADADRWLGPRDPVVLVVEGEAAKAYPLQILIWHEIVNDVVGGRPVAVTFCPLCNTALAFDRRLDGTLLDFGTTGRLRQSDLVMYDRQTESWWQQATGEAIVGRWAGRQLAPVSAPLVSWRTFKASYPNGQVLSRRTGFERAYGENPYERYDDPEGSPVVDFFRGRPDPRLPAMERVAAVSVGGEDVAYAFRALKQRPAINDVVGGVPIAVFWMAGTASALDRTRIDQGRDVGSTGVFDRRLGDRVLEFEALGDGRFRDRLTGSDFDLLGRAVSGPLEGRTLTPIPHGNHFWFAWGVFKPKTRIVGAPKLRSAGADPVSRSPRWSPIRPCSLRLPCPHSASPLRRYRMTVRAIATIATAGFVLIGCSDNDPTSAATTTFTVTVQNVSTPGLLATARAGGTIPVSPGAYAVFTGSNPMFTGGSTADAGTERIAEDGFPEMKDGMLATATTVTQHGLFEAPGGPDSGPAIFAGETATFTFDASPGQRLQLEAMFVQSNDWFYAFGNGGLDLFDGTTPISGDVTAQLALYDAGTEEDTAPGTGDFQKPLQDPAATNV